MFAYVAGSPLVLLRMLHVSPILYAAMFATTGAAIVAGATLNGWLASRGLGSRHTLAIAVALTLLAAFTLIMLGTLHAITLLAAMPLLAVSTFAFGFAAPAAAQGALEPIPELAGVAGGLLASVQMLFGAASSSLVALLFPALGVYAMSGVMAGCALLAGAVWMGTGRGRLTRSSGDAGRSAPSCIESYSRMMG
jgi:MFS transporter, DHA1 family, multidrug resistance protein